MDGPSLSRIGMKPEGFYVIARIPNNKLKQKKLKKKISEYCPNFDNEVKMTRPVLLVLMMQTDKKNIFSHELIVVER